MQRDKDKAHVCTSINTVVTMIIHAPKKQIQLLPSTCNTTMPTPSFQPPKPDLPHPCHHTLHTHLPPPTLTPFSTLPSPQHRPNHKPLPVLLLHNSLPSHHIRSSKTSPFLSSRYIPSPPPTPPSPPLHYLPFHQPQTNPILTPLPSPEIDELLSKRVISFCDKIGFKLYMVERERGVKR